MSKKGLIIVDYQNTFSDEAYKGSARELYVDHGESLAENINYQIDKTKQEGGIILASREEHSVGHMFFASSFVGKMPIIKASTIDLSKGMITYNEIKNWTEENNGLSRQAKFSVEELKAVLLSSGGEILLWPNHCEDKTRGADYHPMLNSGLIEIEVVKGKKVTEHPYSAFGGFDSEGKSLKDNIDEQEVNEIDVVGLATDYCVNDTVLDGLKFGYKVNLILSGSAGVYPLGTYQAIKNMEKQGAIILEK